MNITPPPPSPIAPGVQPGNRHEASTALHQAEMAKGAAASLTVAPDQALTPRQESPAITQEMQKDAVDKLNDFVRITHHALEFSVDEDSGRQLIKLIDTKTKEVIRQIPSEEALQIAKALDKFQGLLIHNKA